MDNRRGITSKYHQKIKSSVYKKVFNVHTWEKEDKHLQIKVEGAPCCGLMLRHRGDDGDVVLGVAGIQEGVETAGPWGDLASGGSDAESSQADDSGEDGDRAEEDVKLLAGELAADVLDEGKDLAQTENSKSLKVGREIIIS